MSDEKKPFAWVEPAHYDGATLLPHSEALLVNVNEGVRFLGNYGVPYAEQHAAAINAAVERERREAAVKALRDKAAFIEFDAKATWDRAIEAAAKCKDHLQYHARVARRQGMFDAAAILNEEAAKIEGGAPCSPTSP